MHKILFVCKGHEKIAGGQLYLKQVASILPEDSFELHYAFGPNDGQYVFNEISKYRQIYTWSYEWRHLSFFKSLITGIKLFSGIKPHIIIFNGSANKIYAPIYAAFLTGIKRRVMIEHTSFSPDDLPIFRYRHNFPMPLLSRYSIKIRAWRAISFRTLTHILFVNNISRHAYHKLYAIPQQRCKTIYNGIDVNKYINVASTCRENIRRSLEVKADEFLVLATGNLTEIKGQKYLILAINSLVKNGTPVKCLIAGEGNLRNKLQEMIKELKLNNRITLLGYRNDIAELLSASDIYCMPSLKEGLGYGILEALASGVPVIASNVGGIPEVITDELNGLLVKPRDSDSLAKAIKTLINSPELRQKLSAAGKKIVMGNFSLQNTGKKILDFFFSLNSDLNNRLIKG